MGWMHEIWMGWMQGVYESDEWMHGSRMWTEWMNEEFK